MSFRLFFDFFFNRATLKKTTDDIELKENIILQMKEQMHQMQTDTANNVHLLQAYLLESDRENEELREKTTDLKTHLSNVIGRVFSSEIRRVELEKSFGGLSKPSPGKVKCKMRNGACIAYMDVVLICIPTPFFKPVSLSLSRSPVV